MEVYLFTYMVILNPLIRNIQQNQDDRNYVVVIVITSINFCSSGSTISSTFELNYYVTHESHF